MRLIVFIAMIVSLVFSVQPNPATAQKHPYGVFQGRIIDANGNIIRGASVTVESPAYTRAVKPNPSGHFGIELPVGVYKIIVKKSGFATHQLTDVVIKAGGYASHVFRLEPSNRQSAIRTMRSYQSATHDKSLDASGGSVFRIKLGTAKVALIRAARSTVGCRRDVFSDKQSTQVSMVAVVASSNASRCCVAVSY